MFVADLFIIIFIKMTIKTNNLVALKLKIMLYCNTFFRLVKISIQTIQNTYVSICNKFIIIFRYGDGNHVCCKSIQRL